MEELLQIINARIDRQTQDRDDLRKGLAEELFEGDDELDAWDEADALDISLEELHRIVLIIKEIQNK